MLHFGRELLILHLLCSVALHVDALDYAIERPQPLKDITAETVAEAFLFPLGSLALELPHFTTDRKQVQFESRFPFFKALSKLLAVQKCPYNWIPPQAFIGMIEELHRPLKVQSNAMLLSVDRSTPIISLGLRASSKKIFLCTPAELVFGTTIRLPGDV
ncbi:integrase catalytic domain-containing protein [Trichonephila clavipes]|nr:integrase catalytic domain-containing protein [Trichonephila clavipes]